MLINVDSTIHDDDPRDVLSAAKAAAILGVKAETLYAYASRGLLRRVTIGPGRRSGYLRADVERLKARSDARAGHGAVAAGALRWGEPVLDTALSAIDERGPSYRGRPAIELARSGVSFERAAELLWTGVLPDPVAPWRPLRLPPPARQLARAMRRAPPVARLGAIVAALGAIEPRDAGADRSTALELVRARALIARMARGERDGASETIAQAVLSTLGATRRGGEVAAGVDRALVVMADHELNASAFAARVAASAGAGLVACTGVAIATVSGTRHGGICDQVEAWLDEAGASRGLVKRVRERARRGHMLPGFVHPLYPAGDPRFAPIFDAARAIGPRETRRVEPLARAVFEVLGVHPTVDFALVALSRAIGARAGAATALFAVARSAGWIAHVLEQRAAGFLLRPRARYVRAPPPG